MYHPIELPINPFFITPSWTNQCLLGYTVKHKDIKREINVVKMCRFNSLPWNVEWQKTNCFLIRAEPKQLSKEENSGKIKNKIK